MEEGAIGKRARYSEDLIKEEPHDEPIADQMKEDLYYLSVTDLITDDVDVKDTPLDDVDEPETTSNVSSFHDTPFVDRIQSPDTTKTSTVENSSTSQKGPYKSMHDDNQPATPSTDLSIKEYRIPKLRKKTSKKNNDASLDRITKVRDSRQRINDWSHKFEMSSWHRASVKYKNVEARHSVHRKKHRQAKLPRPNPPVPKGSKVHPHVIKAETVLDYFSVDQWKQLRNMWKVEKDVSKPKNVIVAPGDSDSDIIKKFEFCLKGTQVVAFYHEAAADVQYVAIALLNGMVLVYPGRKGILDLPRFVTRVLRNRSVIKVVGFDVEHLRDCGVHLQGVLNVENLRTTLTSESILTSGVLGNPITITAKELYGIAFVSNRVLNYFAQKLFSVLEKFLYCAKKEAGPSAENLMLYMRLIFYEFGLLSPQDRYPRDPRSVAKLFKLDPCVVNLETMRQRRTGDEWDRFHNLQAVMELSLEAKDCLKKLCPKCGRYPVSHSCQNKDRNCTYPLCEEKTTHSILCCTTLVELCKLCGLRGHMTKHHLHLTFTTIIRLYIEHYERNLVAGFIHLFEHPEYHGLVKTTGNTFKFWLFNESLTTMPKQKEMLGMIRPETPPIKVSRYCIKKQLKEEDDCDLKSTILTLLARKHPNFIGKVKNLFAQVLDLNEDPAEVRGKASLILAIAIDSMQGLVGETPTPEDYQSKKSSSGWQPTD